MAIQREKDMTEATEILSKPPVGGMDLCGRCGHHQWEHNVDIVVDGKIVRPKTRNRQGDICLHEGSLRCCMAFCRKFEPSV
jgi:hypothetical protein